MSAAEGMYDGGDLLPTTMSRSTSLPPMSGMPEHLQGPAMQRTLRQTHSASQSPRMAKKPRVSFVNVSTRTFEPDCEDPNQLSSPQTRILSPLHDHGAAARCGGKENLVDEQPGGGLAGVAQHGEQLPTKQAEAAAPPSNAPGAGRAPLSVIGGTGGFMPGRSRSPPAAPSSGFRRAGWESSPRLHAALQVSPKQALAGAGSLMTPVRGQPHMASAHLRPGLEGEATVGSVSSVGSNAGAGTSTTTQGGDITAEAELSLRHLVMQDEAHGLAAGSNPPSGLRGWSPGALAGRSSFCPLTPQCGPDLFKAFKENGRARCSSVGPGEAAFYGNAGGVGGAHQLTVSPEAARGGLPALGVTTPLSASASSEAPWTVDMSALLRASKLDDGVQQQEETECSVPEGRPDFQGVLPMTRDAARASSPGNGRFEGREDSATSFASFESYSGEAGGGLFQARQQAKTLFPKNLMLDRTALFVDKELSGGSSSSTARPIAAPRMESSPSQLPTASSFLQPLHGTCLFEEEKPREDTGGIMTWEDFLGHCGITLVPPQMDRAAVSPPAPGDKLGRAPKGSGQESAQAQQHLEAAQQRRSQAWQAALLALQQQMGQAVGQYRETVRQWNQAATMPTVATGLLQARENSQEFKSEMKKLNHACNNHAWATWYEAKREWLSRDLNQAQALTSALRQELKGLKDSGKQLEGLASRLQSQSRQQYQRADVLRIGEGLRGLSSQELEVTQRETASTQQQNATLREKERAEERRSQELQAAVLEARRQLAEGQQSLQELRRRGLGERMRRVGLERQVCAHSCRILHAAPEVLALQLRGGLTVKVSQAKQGDNLVKLDLRLPDPKKQPVGPKERPAAKLKELNDLRTGLLLLVWLQAVGSCAAASDNLPSVSSKVLKASATLPYGSLGRLLATLDTAALRVAEQLRVIDALERDHQEVSGVTASLVESSSSGEVKLELAVRLLLVHSHELDPHSLQLVPRCQEASPDEVRSVRCTLCFRTNPETFPEISDQTSVNLLNFSEADCDAGCFEEAKHLLHQLLQPDSPVPFQDALHATIEALAGALPRTRSALAAVGTALPGGFAG
eukprot:TRINITY_DN1289_c0_g1_i2.p1 TRINITY_DN1289_c0_g1~~TRINITY_DN1289_c0_g1_i2.p1  ORF type:complete len:1085 (-),score=266.78 TRINITY_DN1289_c0_g1_i2:521-3775(-)